MKKVLSLILVLTTMLGISACGSRQSQKAEGDNIKTVYTTFYAMYDFTRTIAKGSNVEVVNVVPSGKSAHGFEPSDADIKDMKNSDGVIYNGKGMEPWIEKLADADVRKLCASEYIMDIDDNGVVDPHVWLSPLNAKGQMIQISKFLSEIAPESKDIFEQNLSDISVALDTLDADYQTAISSASKDSIVVTHAAYGYLCRVYGLNQIALLDMTGTSEATDGQISAASRDAKALGIKYVFYGAGESDKAAKTIAKNIEGEALELNSFEFDKDGRDYITLMRENLEKIKLALA